MATMRYSENERQSINPISLGLKVGGLVILMLIGMTVLFGSWYTVDQTERGVLLRNGAIVRVVDPGLAFKTPWIESVEKISVKTVTYSWDKMNAYSYDQQPADLKVSVTMRPQPGMVGDLYAKFGSFQNMVNQAINPVVNQQVKIIFGRYTAVKAVQDRGPLNSAIRDAITTALKDDSMVSIESVQLENIDFSANYLHSIEQRMQAEVEVQRLQQNLAREKVQADIVVTQANARAASTLAQAKAEADSTVLKGNAEATAIKAKAEALATNSSLISLTQAERWDGKLPATMVPGSAVPFIGVK